METKELNEIISECRRFARKEIRDQALEADLEPSAKHLEKIWSQSAQLDIPALLLPEEYGGAGYPPLCGALILDVLASDCAGIASVFAHHFAACIPLAESAAEFSKPYCTQISRMDGWGAMPATVILPSAWSEPELELTQTNDGLRLSGATEPIANTSFSGWFCLFVKDANQKNGVTCLLLSRDRIEPAMGEETHLPGLKMNPFRSLQFNDFTIALDEVSGERGQSAGILKKTQEAFHGFVCAMALGSTRTAYQKAFTYAGQRYQHGDTIIHHQEIQRMLGAMLMKLHAGTAGYKRIFDDEKLNLPFSSPDPMLMKAFCTEAAMDIIIDAIQIHGGYGYMHEYGLEKIMRDVKVLQLLGGSPPLHHVQAIANMI